MTVVSGKSSHRLKRRLKSSVRSRRDVYTDIEDILTEDDDLDDDDDDIFSPRRRRSRKARIRNVHSSVLSRRERQRARDEMRNQSSNMDANHDPSSHTETLVNGHLEEEKADDEADNNEGKLAGVGSSISTVYNTDGK